MSQSPPVLEADQQVCLEQLHSVHCPQIPLDTDLLNTSKMRKQDVGLDQLVIKQHCVCGGRLPAARPANSLGKADPRQDGVPATLLWVAVRRPPLKVKQLKGEEEIKSFMVEKAQLAAETGEDLSSIILETELRAQPQSHSSRAGQPTSRPTP